MTSKESKSNNVPTNSKIKEWLCTGAFAADMLKSFMSFYKDLRENKISHAVIYIDSPGGRVHVCNSMLSIIENSDITWHTVVIGNACSCGLLLANGGDHCYATDRAEFMFHDISAGTFGHPDEMLEDIKRFEKISHKLMTRFAKKTKHPLSWWMDKAAKKKTKDFWFDTKQAKTFGVIEHIGLPVLKTKPAQYEIEVQTGSKKK